MLETEMTLKMVREGEFVAVWDDRDTGCGAPKVGPNVYRYVCEIDTDESNLDDRGFIIDNNDVHEYFEKRYRVPRQAKSCELMAMEAVKKLRGLMPNAQRIAVTIYGSAKAGLTAEWRKP